MKDKNDPVLNVVQRRLDQITDAICIAKACIKESEHNLSEQRKNLKELEEEKHSLHRWVDKNYE